MSTTTTTTTANAAPLLRVHELRKHYVSPKRWRGRRRPSRWSTASRLQARGETAIRN